MKQLLLILFQLFTIAGIPLAGQTTVNNATDLVTAVNSATSDVTITLDPGFVAGAVNLTQPNVNVTIDGEGFVWNTGTIRVGGAGTGVLTLKNLKMDGTTATARLISCTASAGQLVLEKMEFYNSTHGAIEILSLSAASALISYTKIYDNTAGMGPAIWVGNNANVTVNNSTIEGNSGTAAGYEAGAIASKNHSGTLTINNTVFKNNANKAPKSGPFGGGGGAMSLHYLRGKLTINECLFQGNITNGSETATQNTYDGGAIYIFDAGNGTETALIDIKNTTFDSNIATDDGGAMMIQGTGTPNGVTTTITNCTFYNNKAYGLDGGNVSGGAIQLFKNGGSSKMTTTVLGCTFVGNVSGNANTTVDQKGGAIALSGSSLSASVTYNGSTFVGNQVYSATGQVNDASTYKDVSNSSTTQPSATASKNVINVDKGATPTYTDVAVLGRNYQLCDNLSGIKAGVDDQIIPTIPIKPEGIADKTYTGTVAMPAFDERGYTSKNDLGAVQMVWVRFDANGGKWTGLDDNLSYVGTEYYESTGSEADIRYMVTYHDQTVTTPTSDPLDVLTPLLPPASPAGQVFNRWVIDDEDGDDTNDVTWDPTTQVTANIKVKAEWGSTYTVTYDPNGGIGTAYTHATTYNLNDPHTVMAYDHTDIDFQPQPDYSFVSWNTAADGSGTSYAPGATLTMDEDKILYAIWQQNTPPVEPPLPPVPPVIPEEPIEPTPDPDQAITVGDIAPFCYFEKEFRIPFTLHYTKGELTYTIVFSQAAKDAGFTDITEQTFLSGSYITVPVSASIPAGSYEGTIELQAKDDANIYKSYKFTIHVMEAVRITKQPVPVTNRCEGDGLLLSVTAKGLNLSYQWFLNDERIEGATDEIYTTVLTHNKEGLYHVEVYGDCGYEVSDTVDVRINGLTILMKWDDVMYINNVDNRYVGFQWYRNGEAINTYGTAIYYTNPDGLQGTYFVRAYKADGTYDESCSLTFSEVSRSATVAIYPNPVVRYTQLTIESPDAIGESFIGAKIDMYDMSGRKVYTTTATSQKIQIPVNVGSGVYIAYITMNNGRVISQKVVVK